MNNNEARSPAPWHALPWEDVLARLQSRSDGISAKDAAQRLARVGLNRLTPPKQRGPLLRFLQQFNNVLIYVLLVAAAVTAALGHWIDTAVILGVVLINAIIGFVQEGKAEEALNAIRNLLSLRATVLRDGQRRQIPAEELVPGDIVVLTSGDKVPADLRLLRVRGLRIDEAALTGESEPVEKSREAVARQRPIAERSCMAYSGTLVTYGQGAGVVVATRDATEIGRIGKMIAGIEELTTPLLRQMAVFGRWLSLAIVGVAAASYAFGVLVRNYSSVDMFLAAVSIAVAAIPEGLPAIMTITLAIGVQRMARRNAIIRRLPAVETLGSVTVVCSDKTGTLTRNEMTVQRVATTNRMIEVSGVGYTPYGEFFVDGRAMDPRDQPDLTELARAAMLCNDAVLRTQDNQWHLEGDPTEGALLALAHKAGLDPHLEENELPRSDTIPFESKHRFMATLHHDHAGHSFIFLKGAPEQVLEMCSRQRVAGEDRPLDRVRWHARAEEIAAVGQRVLALAFRTAEGGKQELHFDDVKDGFTLLALFGLIDPPREEAIKSVAQCRSAGIQVKMITGDHAATARAVAVQLDISDGAPQALTGVELEKMDETQLEEVVSHVDVFARASPEHKLRLVRALQAQQAIVAMTGDGVNDAPALKRADVGIAMGQKGTEAAKEAAEMVLADDNFPSITSAVEEGRTVYDNLKKTILFILPTNGGEAGLIIAAIVLGIALPITPVQILWVNMVTAVTLALALAFEAPEADVMRRPPRAPEEPLLSRFMVWRIAFVSTLLVAGMLWLFLWELGRGEPVASARTLLVNTLVFGEIVYLFNSRFVYAASLTRDGFLGNRVVLLSIVVLLVLQGMFTYLPVFHTLFDTAPLGLFEWALVFTFGVALFLVIEAEKAFWRRMRAR